MEGQNKACILWVKIRMVHYLLEVLSLYWVLKDIGYFDKKQKSEEEQLLEMRKNKEAGLSEIEFQIENESHKEELIKKIKFKETLEFEHDFVTMAAFSFLKINQEKFWITP